MSSPRRAVALVVGVFVAVVAVVIGATATTWNTSGDSANAAANSSVQAQQPAAQPADVAAEAPASIGTLPDTSSLLADAALATRDGDVVATGDHLVIEKVALSAPVTVQRDGASVVVDAVYRLTISAGPYDLRDMPAVVSVDGVALGIGAESDDLSTLTAYTYDASVLAGSTAAVTYGLPGQASPVWSTTIEVVR